MSTVLSFENAKSWSWGNAIQQLVSLLVDKYRFVRIARFMYVYRDDKGKEHTIQAPLDEGLVDYFDVTLLQNLDSISLVKGNKKKAVARIGGLVVDAKHDNTRYDKHLGKVGAVIACNEELFAIAKRCNSNAHLIPNGVDLELFKPNNRPNKPFTVGYVGNTWGAGAEYKGWKYYVQAVEIELPLQVERKHLLHGVNDVPHDQMPEFYHSVDCIVMPSVNEGCSNTITEALACGVPVLCTKVGFHGERLTDGENVLFIKRDAKDIAAKIKLLKNDEALRLKLSFEGRIFAENNHDIKKTALQYDQVFRSLLN